MAIKMSYFIVLSNNQVLWYFLGENFFNFVYVHNFESVCGTPHKAFDRS